MENFALALSRFRRNKFDDCIILCDQILKINSDDLASQLLKTHAIRRKNYIDDLEFDEEGIGEILLEDHKVSNIARPGTSIMIQNTSKGVSPLIRPVTSSGRPLSGVVRPQSGINRLNTASNALLRQQTGYRAGTSRTTTAGGRHLRIATASLKSLNSSPSLDINDIIPKNIVKKPSLAKAVADYLFYVDKNLKKLLEICTEAMSQSGHTDWWWEYIQGKTYYKLGMLSDSERQLLSASRLYNLGANVVLQLSNLYLKMDQPLKSLEILAKASADNPGEIYYTIYQARIQEMMNEYDKSIALYKSVLYLDNCNFEAIACIGSNHFYTDHPEISLKFYKRLFELGIQSAEIWNNLGLCAYYSGQYDFCLSCFERALTVADDKTASEIWYNISHVAIGLGDLPLAYQSLKIAISYNGGHFESLNNLGVLEIKKGNLSQAKSNYLLACKNTDFSFESYYNYAVLNYKNRDLEESLKYLNKSLIIYPNHFESKELKKTIIKRLIG